MKTYLLSVLIAGTILSILGFILGSWYGPKPADVQPTPPPIVAPIDEHGCDTPGGFVWCEPKQKCLQLWDEKCEGVVTPGKPDNSDKK